MRYFSLVLVACLTLTGCQQPALTSLEADPITERQDLIRGKLDNGMRYILVENQRPEDRVSLQLVVHAGSLDEADDQLGIAHLVEHMAFNGTTDFPANEIIEHQESLGMVFGRDVNAMTEYYTTSYFLHLPGNSDEMMAEGFHMLAQQASALTFDSEELEKERPVVEEEWRRGRSMMGRLGTANREIMLAGSRFGHRDPIGDMELVRHVDAGRIQAFWQDWYHPNNMTMIVVGATNQVQVEAMLNRYFAALPAKTLPARADLTVPLPNRLSLQTIEDKEITTEVLSFNFRAKEPTPTTHAELRSYLVNELTMDVLNKRLREQYKVEGKNISKLVAMAKPLTTGYRNNRLMAILTSENYLAATNEVYEQLSRFAEHGFTQGDLNTERAHLNSRYQQMADNQRDTTNRRILMGVFNRLRTQAPIIDADEYAQLIHQLAATIELSELEAHLKQMVMTQKPVVIAQIKPEHASKLPDEQTLLTHWQQALANPPAAIAAIESADHLMDTLPEPAKITAHEIRHNVHIWTLANGTQVWFEPSDDTPNQLMLRYQGWGGSLNLPQSQRRAAHQVRHINKFGYGGFSSDQLNMLNAGHPSTMMSFVRQDRHGIIGRTDAASLESWMQNMYLQITAPNNDPALWQSTKQLLERGIKGRLNGAEGKFNNAIDQIRYADNPMLLTMSLEELEQLNSSDLINAWQTLFNDAKDHQFIVVGNIKPEKVIALAQRYIGTLPAKQAMKAVALPKLANGKHQVRIAAGEEPMAVTSLLFNSEEPYQISTENQASFISRIISTRLREVLRESAGGVYTVRFGIRLDRERDQAFGLVSYSHAPDRGEELKSLALSELKRARKQGITQAELDEVIAQTKTALIKDNISDRQRISWLKDAAMYGDSLTVTEDYLAWLDNVKLKDVNRLMRRVLATDNWIDAQLVPASFSNTNQS